MKEGKFLVIIIPPQNIVRDGAAKVLYEHDQGCRNRPLGQAMA